MARVWPTRCGPWRWRVLCSAMAATAVIFLAGPGVARSQAAPSEAAIAVEVPAVGELGEAFVVKARLRDASGAPIAGGLVRFTRPSTFFLGVTDAVLLAQATTDESGVARVEVEARSSGEVELQARFDGDNRHLPATGNARIVVSDASTQLYEQHAGVRIPGLNAPPRVGPVVQGVKVALHPARPLAGLWPAASGWPIAAVLLAVWSLYAYAVALAFRIARAWRSTADQTFSAIDRAGLAPAGIDLSLGVLAVQPAAHPEPPGSTLVFPAAAALVVALLPTALLTVIVRSPYTHANLLPAYEPRYDRTQQIDVGPPMLHPGPGVGEQASTAAMAPGRVLLVAHGCAGCHGLDGRGGAVGPAIVPDLDVVRQNVRNGPGGMPVFSAEQVPEQDLAAIVAYLKAGDGGTE